MKRRLLAYFVIVAVTLAFLLSVSEEPKVRTFLPHLPRPIAKEKALVTPVGQGPEGLIVAELCDRLNIRNSFYYWAQPEDLQGYKSLILVLGFSKQGLYSMHKSEAEEQERVQQLVKAAEDKQIPVVLLHVGGQDRRNNFSDELASLIIPHMNYIIVTKSSEADGFFEPLADSADVPITVVPNIEAIKVPLNSVFR